MYRDHEQEVEGGIDDLVIVRWTGHALEAMDFMGPVSRVDVIVRYRISSTENEGELARLLVRHPLGALDGGLKGDSPGDFWVLGSYASKASSYH